MAENIEELKRKLEHYEKIYSIGEYDLAIKGYTSYVSLVKQQIDYMQDFKLKEHIDGKKTETVLYDRSMAIGEKLPDMITRMNRLKDELKIEFDESEGKPKIKSVSPQSIGK